MVRALLSGTKTQTRRIVNPQSSILTPQMCANMGVTPLPEKSAPVIACPYGNPGDLLWVRETFMQGGPDKDYWYRADMDDCALSDCKRHGWRWKPSIFMPRSASRITLEITGVRVERLNDITPGDAEAEGIGKGLNAIGACYCYGQLWESINGPGSWKLSPWVWVISFKNTKGPLTEPL